MSNRFKEYTAARKSNTTLSQEEITKLTTANNAGANHTKEDWIKSSPQASISEDPEKERTIQRDMARDQKSSEQKGK